MDSFCTHYITYLCGERIEIHFGVMYNPEFICLWHILDYSHKILLGLCIYIFGLVAIVLNAWLAYAFITSRLLTFRSHLLLLSLCIASEAKSLLTGFLFFGSSALAGRWLFGTSTCHLFAFLRQLLGVFQIMILTVIAIERYIMSSPKRKGRNISLWYYMTGIALSWISAVVFSLPPLLGYGSYNCDVTGTMCDLDWRLLTPRQVAFNVLLLIFSGLFPVFTIFGCLWVVNCSNYRIIDYRSFDQNSFTKTMTIMISTIFLFWTPQALLSMWIFVQNLRPPRGIPIALSVIAPISVEAAEIIPVLCYLTYDVRLRSALLEICERVKNRNKTKKTIRLLTGKS